MERNEIKYGLLPFKSDLRDYTVKSEGIADVEFEITDMPKVKNQKSISSCVAHSLSSILEFLNKKELGQYFELSTDFIYGMQGIEFSRLSKGMYIREACKIAQKYGDVLYKTIPTNTEMPECAEELKKILNDEIYKEAAIACVKSYARCKTDEDVKYALMTYGPVLAGVDWYKEYQLKDGVISFNEKSDCGGHAVIIYGFNEKGWLVQNSWGTSFGNKGRFILPYEYKLSEAWSFVDADNNDIYKPKRNQLADLIYKLLNFLINLVRRWGKWKMKKILH